MYSGSLNRRFNEVTNQETWRESIELSDAVTDDLIDLTGCTITMTVRDQVENTEVLTGSTSSEITILSTGVFQWLFTETVMNAVDAGTYDVGIRILKNGDTLQLFKGTVNILDGIDTQ